MLRWDLHNTGTILNAAGAVLQATGRADADIDWLEAYDALGSGFAGAAVIAIIDTGVRKTHQDLAGRVIAERNFAIPRSSPTTATATARAWPASPPRTATTGWASRAWRTAAT
jgi:hypothetical protein